MQYIQTGRKRNDAKRCVQIIVDDADHEWLSRFHWQASEQLCVATRAKGERKGILIHRMILNAPAHLEVDHINGNRLDNRRENLRLVTSSQNKMNRGPRKDCKSGIKGVSWHKQNSKWVARIKIDGKYKHLGQFETKEEAGVVYNKYAILSFKEYAWLN